MLVQTKARLRRRNYWLAGILYDRRKGRGSEYGRDCERTVKDLERLSEVDRMMLPPVPRRVRVRGWGVLLGLWFVRLFVFPHCCAGAVMLVATLTVSACALAGCETQGHITQLLPAKQKTSATMEYSFDAGGRTFNGSSNLSAEEYAALTERQPVEGLAPITIKYVCIGRFHYGMAKAYDRMWAPLVFLLVFTLFWDGIMVLVVYEVWIKPVLERQLYRRGVETAGRLIALEIDRGKSTSFAVTYEFLDGAGLRRESRMTVSEEMWGRCREGMPVRVLYSSLNPKRSVVYELGQYRLLDA